MSTNTFYIRHFPNKAITGFFVLVINLGLMLAAPSTGASPVPATKPNVIVFLVDDMGWGDSRLYNPESKISMPNLERLANDGMKFTNAHATPKCAPTRYSLLTGNYHWRGRYSYGAWDYRGGPQILDDQWTIATVLRDHGYNTAFIGKGHLGGDFYKKGSEEFAPEWYYPETDIDFARGFQNGPLSYGFNYSYLSLTGNFGAPYAYFENGQLDGDVNDLFIWAPGWYGDSRIWKEGIGMPDWDSTQVGPILTERAIAFIDAHIEENIANNSNNPFFMYYATTAAHGPYTPPELFFGVPVKGMTGMWERTDMIYEIDVELGFLLRALEERSLSENTLLVFISDNGKPNDGTSIELAAGHDGSGGLRGQKGEIWENGHRVPFIAKWGDGTNAGSVIPAGTASNQLIAVHDLTATLAALVGVDLPYEQGRDSFNLLPIMTGAQPENEPVRDYLVEEAREINKEPVPPRFAILEDYWRLILNENDEAVELFDLASDLSESTNLIDSPSQAGRIERMRNMLLLLRDSDRTSPMLLASGRSGPPLWGRPAYQLGQDGGIYLWKNTFDGPYHIEVNGDGPLSEYEIDLLADLPLVDAVPQKLEADDNLTWKENQLVFASRVTIGKDGLDFTLPHKVRALFAIREQSQSGPHQVFVGSSKLALVPTDWIVDADLLPAPPSFQGGRDLGLFVGRDQGGGVIRARWNGNGENHRAEVDLLFSQPPNYVTPVGFEPDDVFVATANGASFDSNVSVWWDGVDVSLTPGTLLGLAYDQDGRIQPNWVNPATRNFGSPNAYRLPRAEPYGKPGYDPGIEAGLFLWKDEESGIWHLRGAAGGGYCRYAGEIVSNRPFHTVSPVGLEADDVLDTTDPLQIVFDLHMWNSWEDAIRFQFPADAEVHLALQPQGGEDPADVLQVGADRWPVEDVPLNISGW